VEGDEVTIDANHPLVGIKLNFDIQIVDVREASGEEIAHNH
jgi:FKBP-type peptidyl-prolyl cis-trans isomerase SlyD